MKLLFAISFILFAQFSYAQSMAEVEAQATCKGEPLTSERLISLMKAGESEITFQASEQKMYAAMRKCNKLTGCAEWQEVDYSQSRMVAVNSYGATMPLDEAASAMKEILFSVSDYTSKMIAIYPSYPWQFYGDMHIAKDLELFSPNSQFQLIVPTMNSVYIGPSPFSKSGIMTDSCYAFSWEGSWGPTDKGLYVEAKLFFWGKLAPEQY